MDDPYRLLGAYLGLQGRTALPSFAFSGMRSRRCSARRSRPARRRCWSPSTGSPWRRLPRVAASARERGVLVKGGLEGTYALGTRLESSSARSSEEEIKSTSGAGMDCTTAQASVGFGLRPISDIMRSQGTFFGLGYVLNGFPCAVLYFLDSPDC